MDPLLLDYLAKKQGQPLVLRDAGDPEAVPAAPTPSPPASAPVPVQTPAQTPPGSALGMDPGVLRHLTTLLGPEFDPERFREAQGADWLKTKRNELNEAGQQVAAAMGNVPYQPRDPTSRVEQNMLSERRANLLGTTEAASKLQGLLIQQSLMDASSPMSRVKQQQLVTMDPEYVRQRYGGEEGIKSVPGFLIAQDIEARKSLADVKKTGAETENLQSDVWKKTQDVAAKIRELDQQYDLKMKELAQAQSEGDKNRANTITAKLLELQNTREMFQAQNPRVVTDRYAYVGPGVPPTGLREKFNEKVQGPTLETARKLDAYRAEFERLAAAGNLTRLSPVETQRMKTLSEEIQAALARRNAAGNSPSQAEIEIAKLMVPEPNAWKDTAFPDRMRHAIDQVKSDILADMDSQARGYQLAPIPEGMSPRDAEAGVPPVLKAPTIRMKTPGGQTVSVPPDKVQEALHKYKFTLEK
ncbi:MAG TPA: hypothetical protein VFP50_18180 [Anaeromyxobacteraceae bacterium]|nr:hypothetical protein [Anaeromyxobacteraceae bacterium]